MFCSNCGKELKDGEVCSCQQQATQPEQPVQPAQPEQPAQQPQTADNSKLFSILSYVGILWLIGLLVNPEKNMPKVRFHVGQGIILSITQIALGIVAWILRALLGLIFRTEVTLYGLGLGYYQTSGFGLFLMGLVSFVVWAASIALMVIGIVNVVKDKENPLPIVGRFAFYK